MNKVLLLDLGGVLADLGDPAGSMRLPMSSEDFWAVWIASPAVRDYESGRITLDRFAERMAGELRVGDACEFLARFRLWELAVFPGIGEMLAAAAGFFRLALLSNTNPVHWQQVLSSAPVFDSFEKLFLSFETGMLKPRAAAFTQVLDHFACSPAEVLFLDDSPANVAGALRLGIRAERVAGPAELADALTRLGRAAGQR